MTTSHHNMSNQQVTPRHNKWNVNCDADTHEALDIIGEWMVNSKGTIDADIKGHLKIPKNKIIGILANEKLKQLGLLKKKNSGAVQ